LSEPAVADRSLSIAIELANQFVARTSVFIRVGIVDCVLASRSIRIITELAELGLPQKFS
jgi:hypothetical protein